MAAAPRQATRIETKDGQTTIYYDNGSFQVLPATIKSRAQKALIWTNRIVIIILLIAIVAYSVFWFLGGDIIFHFPS